MYLIILTTEDGKQEAFYSEFYNRENNYIKGMMVIDISDDTISFDGVTWKKIEFNHL